tara:strand:- start:183 stop:620 length:438 start_codon:yes stop_codon:yes gene_type:complete
MAITPINNWKNILDKLNNKIRSEFGNTLPCYVGHESKNAGSQYLRLDPVSTELIEYAITSEIREFTINMYYYSSDKKIERNALDNVLRVVSRIEALIHDNVNMTLADSSVAYNCRLESTELNTEEEEEKYVVTLEWKCLHRGNLS